MRYKEPSAYLQIDDQSTLSAIFNIQLIPTREPKPRNLQKSLFHAGTNILSPENASLTRNLLIAAPNLNPVPEISTRLWSRGFWGI